jgi:hypothetical protein
MYNYNDTVINNVLTMYSAILVRLRFRFNRYELQVLYHLANLKYFRVLLSSDTTMVAKNAHSNVYASKYAEH